MQPFPSHQATSSFMYEQKKKEQDTLVQSMLEDDNIYHQINSFPSKYSETSFEEAADEERSESDLSEYDEEILLQVNTVKSSSSQYVTAMFSFNGYPPYDVTCPYDTGCTILLAKEDVFPPEY